MEESRETEPKASDEIIEQETTKMSSDRQEVDHAAQEGSPAKLQEPGNHMESHSIEAADAATAEFDGERSEQLHGVDIGGGWIRYFDAAEQAPYYFHVPTATTVWELPETEEASDHRPAAAEQEQEVAQDMEPEEGEEDSEPVKEWEEKYGGKAYPVEAWPVQQAPPEESEGEGTAVRTQNDQEESRESGQDAVPAAEGAQPNTWAQGPKFPDGCVGFIVNWLDAPLTPQYLLHSCACISAGCDGVCANIFV
jgi:hypothetical protein